jgi:hypothetical protein
MKADINPIAFHVIRTTEDAGARIHPQWAHLARMHFWILSLKVEKLVLS